MLIYSGTKQSFMRDVMSQRLSDLLVEALLSKMHRHTPMSERKSWDNSMMFMQMVMGSPAIPDSCGVAIEYNVPLTSKRVDFIVSGYDNQGAEHADLIELKQWTEAEEVEGSDGVVQTYVGGGHRTVAHPSYQAWSYATMIANYNENVQNSSIRLHPCAYAHNYDVDGSCALAAPQYKPYLDRAPLFGKHDARKLQDFLAHDLHQGDDGAVLIHIDHGRLKPSKSLQDVLKSMLDGNDEFVLLDDQKVFFERALSLVTNRKPGRQKVVYVVKGGPGTGKSVVSVNLLARLTGMGKVAAYVTRNSAPREVYKTLLKGSRRRSDIDLLFKGSAAFTETGTNVYDALIVDEAHRLVERSQYEPAGSNQIANIIRSAGVSVFFIDEDQRVKLEDIGTVDTIRAFADAAGARVIEDEMTSQFRCNGSDGYLAWLTDTLQMRETSNYDLEGVDYDFQVFDTPQALEQAIVARNAHGKGRLVAGYCWNWPKASRNRSEVHDIQIGDWGISWNIEKNAMLFAVDEESIHEAGCIHTVQGLEFDYVGVIVGPDMRYENGHLICDRSKRAKTDRSLWGINKLNAQAAEAEAERIIKNTYKVLMTRGVKGCYVYCVDKPLGDYLRRRADFKELGIRVKRA